MNSKLYQFKQELNRVFDDNLHTKQWHNYVDYAIIGLIIISTLEVFASTFPGAEQRFGGLLKFIDIFTTIVFTIEVTLRIWNADMLDPKYKGFWGRVRYCFSFYGLIDILSTYPFYVSFIFPLPYTALKVLRVARLFRVFRYMHSFRLLSAAIRSKKSELWVSLQFLGIVTVILSLILFFVEHAVQPDVYSNGWDSVVWAFLQYVGDPGGFADYPPVTIAGQVIAVFVGVLGIAIFAVPAGLIGSGFTEVMEEEKLEQKIQANIQRIVHSFKFVKDQQNTNLFYVPRYKTLDSILTQRFLTENDIIEAVEHSDCLHIYNLAEAMNRQDRPVSEKVVINYYKNTQYGCCIDRGSKVTIVSTSGFMEPMSSWLAYHIAKLGGFNYIAKEIETDINNPVTYYNILDIDDCPNLPLFLNDIDRVTPEDGWVIPILGSTGIQTGPNKRKEDLHFCYATTRYDTSYDDPKIKISDTACFERMYVDMEQTMRETFGWVCDKNEWYAINPKTNLAYFIKCKNVFTLRVECVIHVFGSEFLSTTKALADVFSRHFEPGVEKPIPPEMLKRPKGHDFGMQDYVN